VSEERVTIAAPDGAVKELDMPSGRRYKARGGGMYDVAPSDAKYVLGIGGFKPNVGRTILAGPRCPHCGFASYFARCSRCGTDRRNAPMATKVHVRQSLAAAAPGALVLEGSMTAQAITALRAQVERLERVL